MRRVVDYDPLTGIVDYAHLDGTGKAIIESIQDCEGIIEYNAKLSETHDTKKDYWRVGTIPLTVCWQWAKECGAKPFTKEWQAFAKKKMQDRDYRKLNPNNIRL